MINILIYSLFTIVIQTQQKVLWKLISNIDSNPDVNTIKEKIAIIIEHDYPKCTYKVLEIYYLFASNEYYKFIYLIQNKTNQIKICIAIYGISTNEKGIQEYFKDIIEIKSIDNMLSIHNPIFVDIQKSVLDYLLDYSLILQYIEKIEHFDTYYIIYCELYGNTQYIFIGKYMTDYPLKRKIIDFLLVNKS